MLASPQTQGGTRFGGLDAQQDAYSHCGPERGTTHVPWTQGYGSADCLSHLVMQTTPVVVTSGE